MARRKAPAEAAPFQGRWRITEMDLWDCDALNLVRPAYLKIDGEDGEMGFIAIKAWLDIRYVTREGKPVAEFSWEGLDERDDRSGRGWVAASPSGGLVGHFFFHRGDDSGFVCEPR
ncbi:MAG: hypothetical protein AAGG56_18850 [Pseudomonadota bacterium]